MDTIIMWMMAAAAVAGGADRLLGNRFGLGKRFEDGFMLLGPTALSMAGIICLAPLLSEGLSRGVVPLWTKLGFDAGVLGGVLAIDMGGYQLAMDLAENPVLGSYVGIIVAATFGCTITFTIPVGMGMLQEEDKPVFADGMLIGLSLLPLALMIGGLLCALTPKMVLWHMLPVFILCICLMLGIWRFPKGTVRVFTIFAGLIRILTTVGLVAGAVQFMTGWQMILGMTPLEEAMQVVASIGIVMLGSLPFAELLQRVLKRPLAWLGRKTGMNGSSITGLLIGIVSVVPAIALMKDMDKKGKMVNAAYLVCAASALAAHMGFTFGVEQQMVVPLLVTKIFGGVIGVCGALVFAQLQERNRKQK